MAKRAHLSEDRIKKFKKKMIVNLFLYFYKSIINIEYNMKNLLEKNLFTLEEEDNVSLFIKYPENYVKKSLIINYEQKIEIIIKVDKFDSLIKNVDKILEKINSGLPDKIKDKAQIIENEINLNKLNEKV